MMNKKRATEEETAKRDRISDLGNLRSGMPAPVGFRDPAYFMIKIPSDGK
jgi:hypothetical protein